MNDQKTDARPELKVHRLIAFIAIFLVLIGQFVFLALPQQVGVVPPFFWVCVAGVILFLLSQLIRPSRFVQALAERIPSETAIWITAALILSVLAAVSMLLFQKSARINYIPVTTIWLGSALCYVMAFGSGAFAKFHWKEWWQAHRNELIVLGVVTLAAAALRFYDLGSIPRVVDGDEGRLGLIMQSTTSSNLANPFALWENFGGLYLQLSNLSLRLFGTTPFALRLLPAISGVLAIPSVYLLARQIAGRRVALLSAILLAISHTHIHFSRISSVGYIHATWLVPLELYFLLSGLQKRSSWRAALGGAIVAIHFCIYLSSQIIVGLVLAYMLIALAILRPWIKTAMRQFAAFWGGLGILILPILLIIYQQPNEFINRLGENGTFQSGWLMDRAASTGQSPVAILAWRVMHAFLSLIYYPGSDFYGSPATMLPFISGVFFLIGIGIALWRIRTPNFLLLNGYLWGMTVAVGVFAIPPSADSYRMLLALPAAMILAAIGLDRILELFGLGWREARSAYRLWISAILLSLLVFNLWTYFGDFAGQCRYGDNLAGRFASYLGNYVRTISRESSVYLLSNDTYFYGSHASVDFLDNQRPIINFPASVNELHLVSGETVIASPDRITELETWAHEHPGGQLHSQYDCQKRILLSYQIP